MLALMTIGSIICLLVLLVLSLPLAYDVTMYVGKPFHFRGAIQLGQKLCFYSLLYQYGKKPVTTQIWFGKKRAKTAPTESMPTAAEVEAAAKAIESEEILTYDEVKGKEETPSSWKPLVWNSSFLAAFFTYVRQLLWHSRVRTLKVSGIIGLPQPHETGMLAGACYALIPQSVTDLHFNFTDETYDCTIVMKGHIYPIVCLAYTLRFAISRPARQFIAYWRVQKRGETHHG